MNIAEIIRRLKEIDESLPRDPTDGGRTPAGLKLRALIIDLKALHDAHWGYLAAITGLDLGPEKGELELLYHFCPGPAVITLRVRLPRQDAQVDSLTGIIPSAEASERELAEMQT